MQPWFTVKDLAPVGSKPAVEVLIYDEIRAGGCDFFGGVCAGEFITALQPHKDSAITLRIDSVGGDVFAGVALYHYLSGLADLTVIIDGIAASIASVVALAGKTVVMPENAFMLLHDPHAEVYQGTSADLRKMADEMDRVRDNVAAIYARKTGGTKEQALGWMAAETWFNGTEAKAAGLVDTMAAPVSISNFHNFAGFKKVPIALRNGPLPAVGDDKKTIPMEILIKALADARILDCGCGGNKPKPTETEVAQKVTTVVTQLTTERDTLKGQITALEGSLAELRNKQTEGLQARAKAAIAAAVDTGKLDAALSEMMVAQYLQDESKALEALKALKVPAGNRQGIDPLKLGAGSNGSTDRLKNMRDQLEREKDLGIRKKLIAQIYDEELAASSVS